MLIDYLKNIITCSRQEFYLQVCNELKKEHKCFIITANPEILMFGTNDKVMNDILMSPDVWIIPDGIGVVKAISFVFSKRRCKCNTGIELVQFLLNEANNNSYSIALYGAKQFTLDIFVKKCHISYPNAKIVLAANGFNTDELKIEREIITLKPDIVFVALGSPRQEKFINRIFGDISKGICVGVGGSFDVLSGTVKRAPHFFLKHNLEWLYRITKEPKRLKRFFKGNFQFVIKIFFEKYKVTNRHIKSKGISK